MTEEVQLIRLMETVSLLGGREVGGEVGGVRGRERGGVGRKVSVDSS